MSDDGRLSDGDLHAYLDDNLDQPRRAEIDAILATDDDAAERLRCASWCQLTTRADGPMALSRKG